MRMNAEERTVWREEETSRGGQERQKKIVEDKQL